MEPSPGRALLAVFALAIACGKSERDGGMQGPGSSAGGTEGSAICPPDGVCEHIPEPTPPAPPLRRLSGRQYRNSVQELTGVSASAPEEDYWPLYDAEINDYEKWLGAAGEIANEAFGEAGELPALLACDPALGDRDCALSVIERFGLRAFRRPLRDEERTAFSELYDNVLGLELTHVEALREVVRAMLSSGQFLHHLELVEDPQSGVPLALDSYALAARLSFGLWNVTPTDELLNLAQQDLTASEALIGQVLGMTRSQRAQDFADAWLGLERLPAHTIDSSEYPAVPPDLTTLLLDEAHLFVQELLVQELPASGLLTHDVAFVNDALAAHYALAPVGSETLVRVSEPLDQRQGLLGLGAFLTVTSDSRYARPLTRGGYVSERLLCSPLPVPPDHPGVGSAEGSVREYYEQGTVEPDCAACHGSLNPPGYALMHFDAVGRYTDTDSNGYPIDSGATLDTGVAVTGLIELSLALAADPRFASCLARQLLGTVLQRGVDVERDQPLLDELSLEVANGASLTKLLQLLVVSDAFRYRQPFNE
jgi:hypothetical protein